MHTFLRLYVSETVREDVHVQKIKAIRVTKAGELSVLILEDDTKPDKIRTVNCCWIENTGSPSLGN